MPEIRNHAINSGVVPSHLQRLILTRVFVEPQPMGLEICSFVHSIVPLIAMGLGNQLSKEQRSEIIGAHRYGVPFSDISGNAGIRYGTVKYNWQKRDERPHDQSDIRRSGRPRKLSRESDDHLVNILSTGSSDAGRIPTTAGLTATWKVYAVYLNDVVHVA
jgi:transposase